MNPDPVIARADRMVRRARSRTTLGRLEALLADRTRWQRKQTIATNKLAAVQRQIDALAVRLADEKFDNEIRNAS